VIEGPEGVAEESVEARAAASLLGDPLEVRRLPRSALIPRALYPARPILASAVSRSHWLGSTAT